MDLGLDLEPALAKAPPSRAPVRKSTQADLDFAKADSFEAEALARAIATGCVIGDDLARGLGAAIRSGVDPDGDFDDEDAPLLSVSVDEPPPPRAVSQSTSRVALSPQPVSPGRFGAVAETRLTVAPITFGIPDPENFKNDILFTLELAGEFALRAVADGQTGKLFFGPDGADDARPVARLSRTATRSEEPASAKSCRSGSVTRPSARSASATTLTPSALIQSTERSLPGVGLPLPPTSPWCGSSPLVPSSASATWRSTSPSRRVGWPVPGSPWTSPPVGQGWRWSHRDAESPLRGQEDAEWQAFSEALKYEGERNSPIGQAIQAIDARVEIYKSDT